jgi:hypothetical protein
MSVTRYTAAHRLSILRLANADAACRAARQRRANAAPGRRTELQHGTARRMRTVARDTRCQGGRTGHREDARRLPLGSTLRPRSLDTFHRQPSAAVLQRPAANQHRPRRRADRVGLSAVCEKVCREANDVWGEWLMF